MLLIGSNNAATRLKTINNILYTKYLHRIALTYLNFNIMIFNFDGFQPHCSPVVLTTRMLTLMRCRLFIFYFKLHHKVVAVCKLICTDLSSNNLKKECLCLNISLCQTWFKFYSINTVIFSPCTNSLGIRIGLDVQFSVTALGFFAYCYHNMVV